MFIVDEVDGTAADSAVGIPSVSTHPSKSLIIGGEGAFIPYPNHSFLSYLGPRQYILMIDWRSERRFDQLASQTTYDRCERAVKALPAGVEHLVVLLGTFHRFCLLPSPLTRQMHAGVPIAYPRMVALENILESKFNPMTLLARAKLMPSAVNKFNAFVLPPPPSPSPLTNGSDRSEAELKDDLADHPCAGDHKAERNALIERFQRWAVEKHVRISFMSGDVHCSANSKVRRALVASKEGEGGLLTQSAQFYSKKKLEPAQDPKYMCQIISSAIVNTPPPPPVIWLVSKLGGKKHKVSSRSPSRRVERVE